MSRFAPLFEALTKTQADELRLIHGERIYVIRKGVRQDIGKEPLMPANIEPLVSELLPLDVVRQLGATPHTARIDHAGHGYYVSVRRNAIGATISITPESAGLPPNAVLVPMRMRTEASVAERSPMDVRPTAPVIARFDAPVRTEGSVRTELSRLEVVRAEAPRGGSAELSRMDELLREMIQKGASDLHLSSGVPPVLRLHGEMHFLKQYSELTSEKIYELLRPLFTDRARQEFDEHNDADFAYEVPKLARFRVNAFRDRKGVGAVLRQIPIEILPAEKLGLPKAVLDLCYLSKGLVVVTGPTGSGKSTTLASMIDYVNKNRADHIITIEDPVEFVHQNIKCLVNQREVGQHTRSFKHALRAALREDPDIVMVGEMRDLETVSIAMETAETGHLVFGTLHTSTAVSTVDRIIDQFPTDQQPQVRVMLSESLKGVVAQVLCKRIGGGRVAALEILLVNHAVSALIRDGKTFQIPSVMQTGKGQGMVTMNDSLLQLVQSNQVAPLDAYIKAVDKTGLLAMFKNAGIPSPV